MTWLSKLYQTYEAASAKEEPALWALAHFVKIAHLEVVLDMQGNFIPGRVSLLNGAGAETLIPVSESSVGRSGSKIAPHPLCEELGYCAADMPTIDSKKHDAYMAQLDKWCSCEKSSHPKVRAVLNYLKKGTLWADLTAEISFPITVKNRRGQGKKVEIEKTFIRWKVEQTGVACSGTWEDKDLIACWIDFDRKNNSNSGFCVVDGQLTRVAGNHPRFIRNSADGARLISSNDSSGFTYRGKFLESKQTAEVGFGITQKAHNALRWLITRQGYRNGDQVIVAWAISGKKIPSPFDNTYSFLDENYQEETEEKASGIDHGVNLGNAFAVQLRKKLSGYQAELGNYENIIIMGLDSATPGRMGITYYRESNATEFFERLYRWHVDFVWPQRFFKTVDSVTGKKEKPKVFWFPSVPAPKEVAEAAYGRRLSDSLKKSTVERLLPCIVDNQPFPKDLVDACIHSASNRAGYVKEDVWLWVRNVNVACAVYKGYCLQKKPEMSEIERRKFAMSLDRECTSRDYLYGRLLAVAEQIERMALDSKDKGRITNAEGLMQRFSFNPAQTWPVIHDHLIPYKNGLRVNKPGLLWYWDQEIQEISALFDVQEFNDPKPLSGEYLLGYYCQKNYRKPKKNATGEVIDPTENEINQEEI